MKDRACSNFMGSFNHPIDKKKGTPGIRLKAYNSKTWDNAASTYKQSIIHTEGVRHNSLFKFVSGLQPEISNGCLLGVLPQDMLSQTFSLN